MKRVKISEKFPVDKKFAMVSKNHLVCMLDTVRDEETGRKWDECCCQCAFQVKIYSHPWYNGMSIMHQLGWGCCCDQGRVTMSNGEHSLCECFTQKKEQEDDL